MENVLKQKNNGGGGFVQFFFALVVVLFVLLYFPRVFVHISHRADGFFAVDVDPASQGNLLAGDDDGGNNAGDGVDGGGKQQQQQVVVLDNQVHSPCSAMRNDTICCDRSDFNTDVCFMSGDVRTDATSLSLLLFPAAAQNVTAQEERVRPYTRKWEPYIMKKIQEVRLIRRVGAEAEEQHHHQRRCDVRHDAPLLVMTAGGYTGNLFHAFNDGLLPAWVTAQHLRRRVVLGVLSYSPWWAGGFREIISGLSAYDVVDLVRDKRTHCFPGAIVGLRFHGMLRVDAARLRDNKTIVDFHDFLAGVYEKEENEQQPGSRRGGRPRLGIVSRKGTRVIENQAAVARLAASVGFDVDILETANGTPLSAEYAAVSACDALVGVHGADLTKFLFLRPGRASLAQIAPLGISPIARDCFGKPAAAMGVQYEQYEVRAHESSLSRKYPPGDVVLADPEAAKRKVGGWDFVARVYLGWQNVSLDLGRFRHTLDRMHKRALHLRRHQRS